jgi:hypothetical protein
LLRNKLNFSKHFDGFIVKLAPNTFWGNDGRKRDALKMCAVELREILTKFKGIHSKFITI